MTETAYTGRTRVILAGDPVPTTEDVPNAFTSAQELPSYIPPDLESAWNQGDIVKSELHYSLRVNPYDPVSQPEQHAAWISGWHGVPLQRDAK